MSWRSSPASPVPSVITIYTSNVQCFGDMGANLGVMRHHSVSSIPALFLHILNPFLKFSSILGVERNLQCLPSIAISLNLWSLLLTCGYFRKFTGNDMKRSVILGAKIVGYENWYLHKWRMTVASGDFVGIVQKERVT